MRCQRCMSNVEPINMDGRTHGLCNYCHGLNMRMPHSAPGSTPSARRTLEAATNRPR